MKTAQAFVSSCFIAAATLGLVLPTNAQDGNTLLQSCQILLRILDGEPVPKNSNSLQIGLNAGYCNGLMIGAVNTMMRYKTHQDAGLIKDQSPSNRSLFACFPDAAEISTTQLFRVMVAYLTNHPEELHKLGPILVERAFIEAFPCK